MTSVVRNRGTAWKALLTWWFVDAREALGNQAGTVRDIFRRLRGCVSRHVALVDGLRTLESHANDQLAAEAHSDRKAWSRLIDRARSGDLVAVATISSMYSKLIYTMNRGRGRHVDDHEGDVLEALWVAIQQCPADPDAMLRSARRVMDRAATASKRAARALTFDELPVAVVRSTSDADEVGEHVCAREQLAGVLAGVDARSVRTFAARAGLVEHDCWTRSPTARSLVRNVRHRLTAA